MTGPRSLADDLRSRGDAQLERLLTLRPDLLRPAPSDITTLTSRATTGPSVARFLDGIDAVGLHVMRVAADLTAERGVSDDTILAEALEQLDPRAREHVQEAMALLIDAAMLWGDPKERRAVHAARALVSTAPLPSWPPQEVRTTADHAADEIDARAALAGRDLVGQVRDLLDDWSVRPPSVLRSGGLALRDLAAARSRLHADWSQTALTIELAHAALLVADDQEDPPHWVPTDAFDSWAGSEIATQWTTLAQAWILLPRLASLADQRTQVLTDDRDRRAIVVLRCEILELLASVPAGTSIDAQTVREVLDFRQPRRAGELRDLTVRATMVEAELMGITASGALSTAGRLLAALLSASATGRRASEAELRAALVRSMPADIERVIIQADLTIVAPGPLASSTARSLRVVADVESRGHATVYRIGESSIRRALDSGWDASSIHQFLSGISSSPVPQPLTYLIDDLARRHGAVRTGPALGYVRSDNPETLSALLSDRRLRSLGLTRIADTVLISQEPPREVVELLRTTGYAPAAESPDGQVLIHRPDDRRIRTPRAAPATRTRPPGRALVTAAVRALRAADAAGRRGPRTAGPAASRDLPGLTSAAIVSRLKAAIAETVPVVIGYADTDGAVTQQVVDPIRVAGGVLTAFDHRSEQVRTFAVSRITGLADVID